MLKIAARVLDIYDDHDHVVARQLPPDALQLKVAEQDEVRGLPDWAFGLVMKTAEGLRRRYPVHSRDALKLSEAYFDRVRDTLPLEVTRVAEAKFAAARAAFEAGKVDLLDLDRTVAYVDLAKVEPLQKVAFTETCWGLTLNGSNHYPLHDADLVKLALARFPSSQTELPADLAFLYARTLEKRAAALGVPVPSDSPVNFYTNPTLNPDSLAVALDQRRKIAAAKGLSSEILDQLEVLAGCRLQQAAAERDSSFAYRQAKQASLTKLSEEQIIPVLLAFDRLANVGHAEYRHGLLDPFAACFRKHAAAAPSVVDGIDLSTIDLGQLTAAFDAAFVEEFKANPVAVYKSLPDPVKAMIRGMVKRPGGSDTAPAPSPVSSVGDPMNRLNPAYSNGTSLSE